MIGMGGSSPSWGVPPRAISTCRNSQLVQVKRMSISGEPDTKGTSTLPSPQGSGSLKKVGRRYEPEFKDGHGATLPSRHDRTTTVTVNVTAMSWQMSQHVQDQAG